MAEFTPPRNSVDLHKEYVNRFFKTKVRNRKVAIPRKPNHRRSILHERAITKELRKQLLIRKQIIKIFKELYDFPIKYEYVDSCLSCNGSGCDFCNQTGIRKTDVTDIIKYPICQNSESEESFNKRRIHARKTFKDFWHKTLFYKLLTKNDSN